jgi:drug/metabolite transporter (DMT)-like permease
MLTPPDYSTFSEAVNVKRALGLDDAELMLVVLFWAFNVTVVKVCLRDVQPLAFNCLRFACASIALLVLARWQEGSLAVRRQDMARMILLGIVGHALYQLCFIEGLARTTASSTSLIFGSTPIVVGLMSRLAGHERIGPAGGAAALLAFLGVYFIVAGKGGPLPVKGGGPMLGDLLVFGAVLCWSTYTVLSARMLSRYSPLRVTAVTLTIGAVLMVPPALPEIFAQDWAAVPPLAWAGLIYSFVFALVVSYVLWYRSVKKVGNLRTALYSNLVPVFGTMSGVWLMGDRLTPGLGLGATCILGAIILSRLRKREVVPAETT